MQWKKKIKEVDDWFKAWIEIFLIQLVVFQCRILKYSIRGLLQRWTKSSIIPSSIGESVWRNKSPERGRFLRVDRMPTWSTINSGVTGIHGSVGNYTDLFTIVLRNDDIQEFDSKWDGFYCLWRNPESWHPGRIVQSKNTRVWKTQDRIGICTTWKLIRRS